MTIDKQKLKALADAATPGPWKKTIDGVMPEGRGFGIFGNFGATDAEENRTFIAAANPATILALLAEIERLESQVRLAGVAGEMAVHEAVGRATTDFGVAVLERDRLKAENEALRKDADRLNWLDDHYANVVEGYGEHAELVAIRWAVEGQCSTVREALDDAMAKEASRDC